MIRLLKKEEIAKAQNADRAREVAEGLKVSRRVDSLRELMAKEEEALDRWRSESLSQMRVDLSNLNAEKEKVTAQLEILKEQAQRELSKTDRQRLEELQKSLEIREKSLIERSQKVDLEEVDVALAQKEAQDAASRARTHEEEAERLHRATEIQSIEATQTLQNARRTEENANRYRKEAEESLQLRENAVSLKERTLEAQEEGNLKMAREVANEKVQLLDQRKTLERALERLRKNRLA